MLWGITIKAGLEHIILFISKENWRFYIQIEPSKYKHSTLRRKVKAIVSDNHLNVISR